MPIEKLLCRLVVFAVALFAGHAAAETLFIAPDLYSPHPPVVAVVEPAEIYFAAAKQFAELGLPSLAFQNAARAVATNPAHAEARKVLGYVKTDDGKWTTPYAARMQQQGKVWHEKFGWLAADDVARYEAGERRLGKRWISASEDAEQHATIDDGWRVRTDHYSVVTNHSLEAAVELAAQLEEFHQVWQQLFAGFWLEKADVKKIFAGERTLPRRSAPYRVVMHKNKAEYIAALAHRQPRIGGTLGIYFDTLREAHFFATEDQAEREAQRATLFHEAAHQLFQEIKPTGRNVGKSANFWVVEGVACYLESLRAKLDQVGVMEYEAGAADSGRLPAAIKRRLVDDYYISIEELTALGMSDLQRRTDLAPLYSQSAGLATFFMHGEEQTLREPFVDYLRAVYGGRPDSGELARIYRKKPGDLDARYRQFLLSLSQEPAASKVE
jgi:hypothetical protein